MAELGATRTGQFLHLIPVFGAVLSMTFHRPDRAGHLAGDGLWPPIGLINPRPNRVARPAPHAALRISGNRSGAGSRGR
ncbi:MAG: hypothetical protein MUC53_04150 [Candidatus Contendobacter sp.]|nr:hypothetical protein [Candidatus Contendobacter sp.]